MQELTHLTATELTAALRERRVSAVDVLDAHLAQIARRNPTLNAVITLDEDGARKWSRQADEALARGELWGPLHGLPMTLKDGHSTAGMRTVSGYPPLAATVPTEDGTVAARLKAAGAIIIGKTNVSELLDDIQSFNPVFGQTNNPWNLERTPGGSSGGACAALITGMTPLEVGSDLAGSIRVPAHFCGVYGLKTTERRVSLYGHIPDLPGAVRTHRLMWSIGPLARSVDDLALAYSVIAGPDGHDFDVPPVPLEVVPSVRMDGLRIAWSPTFPGVPAEASIRQAVEKLASELARSGAYVEEKLPDISFEEQAKTRYALSRSVHGDFAGETGDDTTGVTLSEHYAALHRRDHFIAAWESLLTEFDVFLCPVTPTVAFTHRPTDTPILVDGIEVNYWRSVGFTGPFNMTGHPAAVVPVGLDGDGLPIGVQVVGRLWGESRLLAITRLLAEVAGPLRWPALA